MEIFGDIAGFWMIAGFVIVIVMLLLSLIKKVKWGTTGYTFLVYLVGLILFVCIGLAVNPAKPQKQNTSKSKPHHSSPAFVLKHSSDDDDDDIYFETDSQGNYNVTLLGKRNSKITIKNENSDDGDQQVNIHTKIRKGQTLKVPVHLNDDTIILHLIVKDSDGHKKSFAIGNESDAYNSSSKAESESLAQEESDDSTSSSSSDSSTTKYPHYSSNSKVAKAINNDFSNSAADLLENTKVTYKDPIFYVSVPNSILSRTSGQQKEFYESIARAIHSYQKHPTGVVYFEDQQGNILAKTKALNNNEVKLK